MPTLREFLYVLCGADADIATLERRAREMWPAEKVYVPQIASQKVVTTTATRAEITRTAAVIGTAGAAKRFGVTRRHVQRLVADK